MRCGYAISIPNPHHTRRECDPLQKKAYLLRRVQNTIETAIKPPTFKRPDRLNANRDAQHPQDTPKEAVRFKSMTLKEAYSVPKHTSAICVQSFDDSLNSAIHITYRISLRSSSLREPRYPLLRVLDRFDFAHFEYLKSKRPHTIVHKQKSLVVDAVVTPLLRYCKQAATQETSTFRKGWYGFTIMILPQVHLRKPCYDFYFL